jgi:hypothetical protein
MAATSSALERAWDAMLAVREAAEPDSRLLTRTAQGWAAAPGAGEAETALFDLYLPVLNASAEHPLTVAHLGQSLDGYIATDSGDS